MAYLTRRRRQLWITAGLATLFLLAAGGVAWRWSRPVDAYSPGEDIEGITAELDRPIPADHPRVVFTDVAREAGIAFTHFSGTRGSQLPEDMGSGAAWGDFDGDGWEDLVIANEVGPLAMSEAERAASPARTRLYRNNRDGTFTDATDRAGIDVRDWAMGVAWGDYDNDGDVDLVITGYGTNHLYRNNGDGTFTDRSAASGVGAARGFWTGASWADYDRDGFVDLYVTGYVRFSTDAGHAPSRQYDIDNPASINPSSFPPERNLLYRNNRDGTFTEVARAAGVMDTLGRGLSAAWADLDEDGWPDLYVANDVSDNVLYHNLGNGTFADISKPARVADYRGAMGIGVGDWDGDGDQDLFVTHWLAQENALYTNQLAEDATRRAQGRDIPNRLVFMDDADRHGLGQAALDFVGWGTSFFDYDNDGRLDLFVANGSTLQARDDSTQLVPMRNQLFWNGGVERGFFDVAPVSGAVLREKHVARGVAFADYDNDGDVDLLVVNHGGPAQLLRNDGGSRKQWIAVQVRGTRSNRQGLGATVTVFAGGRRQVRQVGSQSSYLSQSSLVETFGLDTIRLVDSIVVTWPGGGRDVRTGAAAGQRLVMDEGAAPSGAGVGVARLDERARVRAFWELYRRATSLRAAGQTQAAADAYDQALALNPDHEDVLYYAGSMRLSHGDFGGAARAWRHLVRVNAHSARGHLQLATLYACLDRAAPFDLDSAAAHLQRAHQINREESGPLIRLGEVALMRRDVAAARRHFTTVLATNASSAPALFYLGYVAMAAGDTAGASSYFARSVEAAAARPPVAGVAGEGDTKGGASLQTLRSRCDELRALSEDPRGANAERESSSRYRRLDSLMAVARARAR